MRWTWNKFIQCADRNKQLPMMSLHLTFRYIRIPFCIRSLRSTVGMLVPLAWLFGLMYCLISLVARTDLTHPRLQPGGIYKNQQYGILSMLGFGTEPFLYPKALHQDQDLPVFVLALSSSDLNNIHRFLGSFRLHFGQKKLLVYDLGLSPDELDLIRHTCQCLVRTVHWEQYPDHIRDLSLKAYRPILIQETLQEFGMVFWCNPTMRFNSSSQLEMLRLQAEHLGLVAWPSQNYPTSTYTHYGTFRFLNADRNRFLFHRMVEPDSALYCNTYRLHYKLMLPWVQCALNLDCVAPIGSQSHGCDLSRRPRYIYSGCHRYDSAAFNVILGEMFYVDTVYIPNNMPFYRESIALTKLPLAAIVHKSRSAGNTRTRNRKKYSPGRTYNNSVSVATDAVEMEFPWDKRT